MVIWHSLSIYKTDQVSLNFCNKNRYMIPSLVKKPKSYPKPQGITAKLQWYLKFDKEGKKNFPQEGELFLIFQEKPACFPQSPDEGEYSPSGVYSIYQHTQTALMVGLTRIQANTKNWQCMSLKDRDIIWAWLNLRPNASVTVEYFNHHQMQDSFWLDLCKLESSTTTRRVKGDNANNSRSSVEIMPSSISFKMSIYQ